MCEIIETGREADSLSDKQCKMLYEGNSRLILFMKATSVYESDYKDISITAELVTMTFKISGHTLLEKS